MDISVIICTYNRSGSLERTLEHIRKMTVPETVTWELLVVDNNSKDNTRAVVEFFQKTSNIHCKYIFEKNQGLSFARNSGIMHSNGEIIVFTDDDVIVDKNWIVKISDTFRENSDVACIGGKILPEWESPCPKWLKGDFLDILALCDRGNKLKILSEPNVWGANLSFRSSVIRKYGFFDTAVGHKGGKLYGGEEVKYLQRLMDGGGKIMYSPDVLVYHCIPEVRLKKKYFRKWYLDKGELLALQMGEYNNRNLFGIPLIYFRKTWIDMFNFMKSIIIDPDRSLLWQMSLFHNMGIIRGRIKYKFGDNGR